MFGAPPPKLNTGKPVELLFRNGLHGYTEAVDVHISTQYLACTSRPYLFVGWFCFSVRGKVANCFYLIAAWNNYKGLTYFTGPRTVANNTLGMFRTLMRFDNIFILRRGACQRQPRTDIPSLGEELGNVNVQFLKNAWNYSSP